eukprot:601470-Rhodomonas_salina.2
MVWCDRYDRFCGRTVDGTPLLVSFAVDVCEIHTPKSNTRKRIPVCGVPGHDSAARWANRWRTRRVCTRRAAHMPAGSGVLRTPCPPTHSSSLLGDVRG